MNNFNFSLLDIKRSYKLSYLLLCIYFFGCVEETSFIDNTTSESLLVVEATITNELKHQQILLSRTYELEVSGPQPESGASVYIIEDDSVIIEFQETEDGLYVSNTEFSAEPDHEYHLKITTDIGEEYSSERMKITQDLPMQNLYAERGFNENEDEGVSIFTDINNTFDSIYYRYEYEETYKIISPIYSGQELIPLVSSASGEGFPVPDEIFIASQTVDFYALQNYLVDLRDREEQKQICYNTKKSNQILLTSTEDLIDEGQGQFRIRFIGADNYIIAHRYSILVRQYIQSRESNIFYKTLRDFSLEGNLFSEIQTGFIEGNVFSTNTEENVVGFFEVSSVSEERVYFNYSDLFVEEPLPPYYINCDDFFTPSLYNPGQIDPGHPNQVTSSPLIEALEAGMQFYIENENDNSAPWPFEPFILVLEPCGDCTVLGTTTVPEFWED